MILLGRHVDITILNVTLVHRMIWYRGCIVLRLDGYPNIAKNQNRNRILEAMLLTWVTLFWLSNYRACKCMVNV